MCAGNAANLLLARTLARREEIETRRALGASAADVARLVVAEAGALLVPAWARAGSRPATGWVRRLSSCRMNTPSSERRRSPGRALLASLAGLAAGTLAGQWASMYLKRFLCQIAPGDWSTLVMAGGVVVVVAATAALMPCLRALRLSPSAAPRVE